MPAATSLLGFLVAVPVVVMVVLVTLQAYPRLLASAAILLLASHPRPAALVASGP